MNHVVYLQQKHGTIIRAMEEELCLIFQSAGSIIDVKRLLDDRVYKSNG